LVKRYGLKYVLGAANGGERCRGSGRKEIALEGQVFSWIARPNKGMEHCFKVMPVALAIDHTTLVA
jgi:hypothetical protein